MKTLRHSILCAWAAIATAQASAGSGWKFQNPQLTGNDLHGVALVNGRRALRGRIHAGTMIAVGDQGTIVRSMDGGATWELIASESACRSLRCLSVSPPNVASSILKAK